MLDDNQIQEELEEEWPKKEERLLWAISYGPFGFILPLMMDKKTPFVAFHTKQGWIIFWIYFLINLIFRHFFFFWLFTLIYIWLAVYWGMKAYNWEMHEFSFIKKLLEKLNGK